MMAVVLTSSPLLSPANILEAPHAAVAPWVQPCGRAPGGRRWGGPPPPGRCWSQSRSQTAPAPSGARSELATESHTHHARGAASARRSRVQLPLLLWLVLVLTKKVLCLDAVTSPVPSIELIHRDTTQHGARARLPSRGRPTAARALLTGKPRIGRPASATTSSNVIVASGLGPGRTKLLVVCTYWSSVPSLPLRARYVVARIPSTSRIPSLRHDAAGHDLQAIYCRPGKSASSPACKTATATTPLC